MDIYKFSDPLKVKQNLDRYLGANYKLYISTKVNKKYMIKNPEGKWVHFGEIGFEDFTKHQDEERRQQYLARATKIKITNFPKIIWQYIYYGIENFSIKGFVTDESIFFSFIIIEK